MNVELKQRWIKRLKSGKEKKCEGFLHYHDAFCSVGLLCDIINPKWQGEGVKGWHSTNGFWYSFCPSEIEQEVGVEQIKHITRLNDIVKLSFAEIAQYIEENVPSD